jgi:hypothetical protein
MRNYPSDLAAVPESAKIIQAFGWSAMCWACVLILWCSLLFTQPAKPSNSEYIVAAIAFLFASLLIFFEFRRRRTPRVMARFPEASEIGIYKRGLLNRTVQVEEVTLELRHPGAVLGAIVAPATVALGLALFLLPGNPAISTDERVAAGLGALCFAGLAASSIKTGWLCDVCLFPYEKNQKRERMLIRRRELPLLLSRKTKPQPVDF